MQVTVDLAIPPCHRVGSVQGTGENPRRLALGLAVPGPVMAAVPCPRRDRYLSNGGREPEDLRGRAYSEGLRVRWLCRSASRSKDAGRSGSGHMVWCPAASVQLECAGACGCGILIGSAREYGSDRAA